MSDVLVESGNQASSTSLFGVFICIATGALAVWGCFISFFLPVIRPQPPPRPIVENFVMRVTHDTLQKTLNETRSSQPLARSLTESSMLEGNGRPRSGSDPTGKVSSPEVIAERAANRVRKGISICGSAAVKTVTPGGPIFKGARTVLKTLSIHDGHFGKKGEVKVVANNNAEDEDEDKNEDKNEDEQNAGTNSCAKSSRNRSSSVATSTIVAVKALPALEKEGAHVVEYSEGKSTASVDDEVVEALPAPGGEKRKSKLRLGSSKLPRKLTSFKSKFSASVRA